jgi:hypothetical protein
VKPEEVGGCPIAFWDVAQFFLVRSFPRAHCYSRSSSLWLQRVW